MIMTLYEITWSTGEIRDLKIYLKQVRGYVVMEDLKKILFRKYESLIRVKLRQLRHHNFVEGEIY
jgi:hypothetical protein